MIFNEEEGGGGRRDEEVEEEEVINSLDLGRRYRIIMGGCLYERKFSCSVVFL